MHLRRFGPVMTAVILSALVLGANMAAARSPGSGTSPVSAIPVSGTFNDGSGPGTFSGTLDISRFEARQGALVATGTINGVLTNALGVATPVVNRPVTLPVTNVGVGSGAQPSAAAPITTQQAAQDCQILHLEFGGMTLDVLGIGGTLSPITLDLTLSGLLGGVPGRILRRLGGGGPSSGRGDMVKQEPGLKPYNRG